MGRRKKATSRKIGGFLHSRHRFLRYYIYILYSPGSDRYYVGYTYDVGARLKDHNEGDRPDQSTKYTFKHRPWELKASFLVGPDRGMAMKVERFIKRQKSRKFIEKVIESQHDEEKLALLVRVPTRRD